MRPTLCLESASSYSMLHYVTTVIIRDSSCNNYISVFMEQVIIRSVFVLLQEIWVLEDDRPHKTRDRTEAGSIGKCI